MLLRLGLALSALLWCLCASMNAQPILAIERAPDTTRLGCGTSAIDSIVILNSGDAPLIVSSFSFTGANAGDFASCTNPLPVVQPGARASLLICIAMGTPGLSIANATIGSNSLGGVTLTSVPLAARRDLLSVRLSRDTVNFGVLSACGAASDTITIINDGSLVIGAPASSTRNGFRWEPVSSANILPGERRIVRITFVGDVSGSPYTTLGTFGFSGSGCFVLKEFWMKATVSRAPCLVVRVGSISARPGDDVAVTISQDGVASSVDLSGFTMSIEFDYDPTLLVPGAPLPIEISRTLGTMYLNLPLRKGSGPLVQLPFRATLGSSAQTPLRIRSYSFTPAALVVSVENGTMDLRGVCTDPRSRLFDPTLQRPIIRRITTGRGSISVDLIETTMQQTISVYAVTGICVAEQQTESGQASVSSLPPALYIVRCTGSARPALVQVSSE